MHTGGEKAQDSKNYSILDTPEEFYPMIQIFFFRSFFFSPFKIVYYSLYLTLLFCLVHYLFHFIYM